MRWLRARTPWEREPTVPGGRGGEEIQDDETSIRDYGNYFATGFQFKVDQGEGATLALVWAREGGAWKIIAYGVKTP